MKTENKNQKKSSSIPLFLSALVFPGMGQFVQKRWIAGTLFFLFFLAAFILFCAQAVHLIITYYRMGFEFETFEPGEIHLRQMLTTFAIAMLIYIINIFDTAIAQIRQSKTPKE
jgi:TM2 domain-containing membrane protein YozV